MLIATNDIYPVSDFIRKASEHITRLKESRRPEILTLNGKAAVVVQDAQTYEEMADLLESLLQIAAANKEFEQGKAMPASEAFKELNARLAQKYPNENI